MHYKESRERSAELLRAAIGHMGHHDAALNPLSFTVWYEYAAGLNLRLNEAIARRLLEEPRFGDATIERLYREHIASIDVATMERIGNDFKRTMHGMAESASNTGAQAGAFGAQLFNLTQALQDSDAPALGPWLSEALQGTAEMKSSAEALQQRVASSQREIERLQGELTRVRDESLVDTLTGTLNRKGFESRVQDLLRPAVEEAPPNCLVMLDIDHFKKVNDTHGHVMGDKVIELLGEILRTSVTHKSHAVARYGGEEFAILLPRTSLEESLQLAERVRERTKAMKIRNRATQEVIMTVTISAGVAVAREDDDVVSLVARADGALYQAKQSGRNRVTCAEALPDFA
ncbi:diguanylate cyclase [Variovorax sp. HJSM1_2]|uniref:GGDEF domain-containing protein n=1 Tax=Variovorax sp. HJSM1_2 TaxID=3366263 RepID=UPI003BD7B4FF